MRRPASGLPLRLLVGAVLAAALPVAPAAAQSAEPEPALGAIAGRVAIPEGTDLTEPMRAVLLAPEWAAAWEGEVQRRLDDYSNRYRPAIADEPELFTRLAAAARREAVIAVLGRMRASLGPAFASRVREVSPEGRFDFTGVPLGEYRLIVVGVAGGAPLLWAETVSVRSPLPQFVDLDDRIQ